MVWVWLSVVLILGGAVVLLARRVARSEERSSQRESRLAAVLEGADAGLAIWDPAGRLVGCNERFREFYPSVPLKPGVVFEDLIRFTATRGLVQLEEAQVESWVEDRVSQFGAVWHDQLRTPDGRWLDVDTRPTGSGEVILVYADTTRLRESEETVSGQSQRLERQTADLGLLAEVIDIGSSSPSFEAAAADTVAAICRTVGWTAGYAYRVSVNADEPSLDPLPAWYSDSDALAELRTLVATYRPQRGEGVSGRALYSGRISWVPNVAVDPAIESEQRATMTGIRGACAVPVKQGDQVVAVLEFVATEQLLPDTSTERLLRAASNVLGWVFRTTAV